MPARPRPDTGGTRSGPGQVRIIGGRWKRTPIAVPDRPGLRPTPDRVRETLFNWLGQDLAGWRVLDLFSGTGALGMEAASRGAAQVVMVERDPALVRAQRDLCERLDAMAVSCIQADVLHWLARPGSGAEVFDLILLDPPFGGIELMRALPDAIGRLSSHGLLYLEWGAPLTLTSPPLADCEALSGFEMHRSGRAGQVHYHLLRRALPGAS